MFLEANLGVAERLPNHGHLAFLDSPPMVGTEKLPEVTSPDSPHDTATRQSCGP